MYHQKFQGCYMFKVYKFRYQKIFLDVEKLQVQHLNESIFVTANIS